MMRRALLPAVLLASLGGAGLLLAAVPGSGLLRETHRLRGITTDDIAFRPDGSLSAHGVRADLDGLRIEVAEVVTSPAGTASADNVVLTTPRGTFRTKHVELTGSNLSSADLAALLDPKSPVSLPDRLGRINATGVTIADLTGEEATSGLLTRTTYRDIALKDIAAGRIGTATLSGISLTQTDAGGAAVLQATYGPILAHGVDTPLIAKVGGEISGAAGEAKSNLFADLTIEATRLFWPKTQVEGSSGKIALTSFRGRRLGAPLGLLDVGAPEMTAHQRQQRIARGIVTLLEAFELGTVEITDVRVRDVSGTTPTDVTVGHSRIAQPDADRIASVKLEGIRSAGRTGTYRVAEVTADNLDIKSLRDALRAVANGADTSDLAVRRNLTPVMDRLALRQLDADVIDTDRRTGDPTPERMQFHIDAVDLAEGKALNGIPSRFAATLDHLTFAIPRTDAFRPMTEMGYGKLDVSSRFGFNWNENAKELAVDDIWLNGVDMGALRLTAGLSNVGRELFSTDAASVQAAAYGMLLRRLDLKVDNAGLIEKLIARQAADDGDNVDDVRQSYVSSAAVGIPILLGNGAAAKAIGAAAAKFVAQPKTFHLVATAPSGIGVSDMQYLSTPDVLMGKLQVEVKANE